MLLKLKSKKSTQLLLTLLGFFTAVPLTSCSNLTVYEYEATAQTTLTWQVSYSNDPVSSKHFRYEEFASTSLLNRNGQKPEGAVIGPDDRGLWRPAIPPKPSLDDIEQHQKNAEQASRPEILRTVKYRITFPKDGQTANLPTNYQVYRQVMKAYPDNKPLRLTLGINNGSVEKAEPVDRN